MSKWWSLLVASATFFVALVSGMLFLGVIEQDRTERWREQVRQDVEQSAVGVQRELDFTLDAIQAVGVALQHGRDDAELEALAQHLLATHRSLDGLALAPAGVVGHVFPGGHGKLHRGLDLLADPGLKAHAERARTSREMVLHSAPASTGDPEQLLGLAPVYRRNDDFWGYVVGIVPTASLVSAGELARFTLQDFGYELVDTSAGAAAPELLIKSQRDPLLSPATARVTVPQGQWEVRVAPRQGWRNSFTLTPEAALALLASALFAIVAYFGSRQPQLLRELVAQRTRELARANEALEGQVAERRRYQETLQRTEVQLRTILDTMPVAVGVGRLDDGQMLFVNEHAARMLGLPAEQLVGRQASDFYPAVEARQRLVRLVEEHGAVEAQEVQMRRADGALFWVSLSARLVTFSGEPALLTAYEDITDRREAEAEKRRLEAQVRHAQKLESLGVLAGGIAHDFNNLLMIILGNAELGLIRERPEAPARESLERITTAARRASEICNQMLAYAGRGQVSASHEDLSALVREMGSLLEVSVSKRAELRYELADGLPPVEADTTQVRQVVMNLITNASEALQERSGTITLRTGIQRVDRAFIEQTYHVGDVAEGSYVFLEVGDTGCGMDEVTRARIFDPFFTTKFTGRGLGLATVWGIVRAHGGMIQLDSAPGLGTTFRVLLPCLGHDAPAEPTAAVAQPSGWRLTGTVLFVDDEPSLQLVGRSMLEQLGATVVTAGDGEEAIAQYAAHADAVRVVVLDLTMPKMNGDEAMRELRALRADLPIVLCSGYTQAAGPGQEQPHTAFLKKPFTARELAEAVRGVVSG